MPSLTLDELKNFSNIKTPIFIETGTNIGDTINNMLNYFEQLYSIELSHELANYSKNRFKDNSNVTIIEGDSSIILNSICNQSKPTFFWLDGHWSGGGTARGKKDCPLLEEISIINNKMKNKCIIAIDDVRLFGKKINEDWLDITRENVLNIVKERIISCKYFPSSLDQEDRMVLHLKGI